MIQGKAGGQVTGMSIKNRLQITNYELRITNYEFFANFAAFA